MSDPLLEAIHADVREIRSKLDRVAEAVASGQAAHDRRLLNLEAHVVHTGPSKWDIGSMLGVVGAILVDLLRAK